MELAPSRFDLVVLLLRRALFQRLYLSMVDDDGVVVQAEARSFRRLMELYYGYRARGFR